MEKQLNELKEMLSTHVRDSNEFREEMKTTIAKIKVHSEYTQKAVEGNIKEIANLKTVQDKQKGGMWVVGLLGVGGVVKAIVDFVKHVAE